jgi:hypothetical protein
MPTGILTTNVGLVIDDDLAYEAWADAGEVLARAESSLAWAVGDWYAYGVTHWDAKANQLAAALGLAEKTVWNAGSVCNRVPLERRRAELSFGHHEAVAAQSPDQQVRWLELAAEEGLSVHALRERIAAERAPRELPDVGKPRRVPVRFNVTCSAEVPAEVLQEGVHLASRTLHEHLAKHGYETDIAEVL